ncbi:MAG: hypothetical protein QG549_365 [Patescibacteria group bacterium]|nr:hypothetical protein [Patescibacteria group bacterium]
MEMNFMISILFIFVIGIALILGIAIHDIRTIRAKRLHRPKKRRVYPLVSVVVEENVSDECLASIQHSDYHKYEIVFFGERARSKYILSIQHNVLLAPTSISRGVATLMDLPKWEYVEIRPVLRRPQKITELFRLYHIVALAPFISLRVTLKIPPNHNQPWPTLRRANIPVRRARSRLYGFTRWLILMVNAGLISYITVIAYVAGQPLYLLIYLITLLLWLIVCVIEYPHFSPRQRISYIYLSPVAFWYFFLYAFYAPLVPIFRATTNWIASLLWRAHRQTIA